MEKLDKGLSSASYEKIDLKEYETQIGYLEDVRSLIPYDLFEDPTDNEIGFAVEFAWYMDEMQQRHPNNRQHIIEDFRDTLIEKRDDPRGQIIYAKTTFKNLKKLHYEENNDELGVLSTERDLRYIKTVHYTEEDKGSFKFPFSGPIHLLPDWFGARYSESGMIDKVKEHSVELRHQMIIENEREADRLKKLLDEN